MIQECFGYLIKPFVRDKDAIQSTMLLAEVAAYYKKQGKTLYDGLQSMYEKYGYFEEKTISKMFEGIDGKDKMTKIMDKLRSNPMNDFNDNKVIALEDFKNSIQSNQDGSTKKIDLPKSNVLKYWLEDGTWIAIRPSGTEPKVKFYIGTEDQTQAKANQRLDSYINAVNQLIEKLTK